jgi:ligand-binding sensor domain-containing protein
MPKPVTMFLKPGNISLKLFICLAIIFIPLPELMSQSYFARVFTTENGLPHNNVRDIAVDSSGFLWVATWDGLSKYDGYDFKNYFHIPGDSASIPYFSVFKLCIDGADNLWVLTDLRQVVLFDRKKETFKLIGDYGEMKNDFDLSISVDDQKNLWIVGRNMLLMRDYRTGNKKFYRLKNKNGEDISIDHDSYSVFTAENGKIWLCGTKTYEFEIGDIKDGNRILVHQNTYSLRGSFQKVIIRFDHSQWFSLFKSNEGNMWLFSNYGLFILNREEKVFNEYTGNLPEYEFTGKKIFYWGSVFKGLFLYYPQNQKLINVPAEDVNLVKAICPQTDNLIWFSSTTTAGVPAGLSRLVITPDHFKKYSVGEPAGSNPAVFAILKDSDDVIWTAVRGKDYITKILPDGNVKKEMIIPPQQTKSSGHLRTILEVPGGIWLGYINETLLFFNKKTGKYILHKPERNQFYTMINDSTGNLYIGGSDLSIYNPVSKRLSVVTKPPDLVVFYKLYFDREGYLWGTMNYCRLLRINPKNGKVDDFKLSDGSYNIEDIVEDQKGNFWLALLGGGICMFNPETGSKKFYTTSSGLSNNTTYCLLLDKSGNLWITTDNGISRLNTETEKFRNFNRNDGLLINEFNSDAKFVTDKGEFLLGGMGGIVGFYPDILNIEEKSRISQKILITGISISGEKYLTDRPVNECDTIILKKGKDNIQLGISSTDFEHADRTLYRYRLSVPNNKWIEGGSGNRNINYSHLGPGWHVLEIEATDIDGNWSAEKKLHIKITPYFYETRMFPAFVVSAILAIIFLFLSLYIRQLKIRASQKQDQMRLHALRGQMNPHFIFNSLNSINYFISNNDKMSANRYIADFSRIIRSILSNMETDYIPFEEELASIKDYLDIEHLRFGDKFDFKIDTGKEVSEIQNFEVFPGLVQPFIENAIWHGVRALERRKGLIHITFFSPSYGLLKCVIEDDGIGRKKSNELRSQNMLHKYHQSKGIGIVMERLQLVTKQRKFQYSVDLTDLYPNKTETGTRVVIDIPVKQK